MGQRLSSWIRRGAVCTASTALIVCWVAAGQASAATPDLLWKTPADGIGGGGAGRFDNPSGIAADPQNGHLFVADPGNSRIAETTVWGEFVKVWGWGVVASGPGDKAPRNERQELTVNATAGTYKIEYYNTFNYTDATTQPTEPIPFNASAAAVQAALEGTESLNSGDFTVSGSSGGPYTIEFVGKYADFDVPQMKILTSGLTGTASVKTLQGGGSFEICVPANGDVCQRGQRGGTAPGQTPSLNGGVAVDDNGDLYAYERLPGGGNEGASLRVQKFDSDGTFLAMWGGEVNKTKSAEVGTSEAERNLCTKAQIEAGDVCGGGVSGTGKGQFQTSDTRGGKIAIGPTGSIFVADKDRIQKFSPVGAFEAQFNVPGESIQAMAMDDEGNFYVSLPAGGTGGLKPDVRKLVPAGEGVTQTMTFASEGRSAARAIAVDGEGNVYISEDDRNENRGSLKVIAYDKDGNELIGYDEHFAENEASFFFSLATSEACGITGVALYIVDANAKTIAAYGPPPDTDICPPPAAAPSIVEQYAASVDTTDATLRAKISPRFWPDTRYYVEYGTGKCSEGGCNQQSHATPGLQLTEFTVDSPLPAEVYLGGLRPDTTYHYRFVAESSGGGPVKGWGGKVGSDGTEGSFTTFAPTKHNTSCPNQAFRIGVAATLPDCRAYEMVSPEDKNGADIATLYRGGSGEPASFNQSSPDGERLAYTAFKAFGDAQSSPYTSAYMASRGAEGWSTHGISPPRGRTVSVDAVANVGLSQFKAFSPDLCSAWVVDDTDQSLAAGSVQGFMNLYRRDNCGEEAGAYTALSTVKPPNRTPSAFVPEVQGFSADGSRAIFRGRDALTVNAPDPGDGNSLLYESFGAGKLRFVCLLPSGAPVSRPCSAGTGGGLYDSTGREASLSNAISADGSRIFWSESSLGNTGPLYVRIGGKETLQITAASAQYWTAADDGSKAIYTVGELGGLNKGGSANLYEYDVDADESELIAGKVDGLLGASEDASRVYLVSEEARDGAAVAGEPNLYLYEEGSFTFIARLARADADAAPNGSITPVAVEPRYHMSEVTADGNGAVFMSTASLTGYDNSDLGSGAPNAEIFVYDAEAGELRCASCNPTGQRPRGTRFSNRFRLAARIPVTESEIYQTPRVLTGDGQRLFFESYDSLALADTNGALDVYQWEVVGKGDCTSQSATYSASNGGCVALISSGESPAPSRVYAVDEDGSDVFISTSSSLLGQDTGLVDVYDARINGGFPTPVAASVCEGEACQGPLSPPNDPTPASAAYEGPGNPQSAAKKKAAKKKAAKKKKAKAKKAKQRKSKSKRANRNRRTGR